MGSLEVPEETLLRYVRLIKNGGLRAKPQFAVKFNKSDIPISGNRAFGAYIVPRPRSSGKVAICRSVLSQEMGLDLLLGFEKPIG